MRRRTVLIPRNTPLPATGQRDFVTQRDGQASVRVSVVEGGDITGRHSTRIGKCVVTDLPDSLPAKTRVRVSFDYSASGLLAVGAALPGTGRRAAIAIRRESKMAEASLLWWQAAIDSGDLLGALERAAPADVPTASPDETDDPDEGVSAEVHGAAADALAVPPGADAVPAGAPDPALEDFLKGFARSD
jgi:hypothetical protein